MNFNLTKLEQIVAEAKAQAASYPRWERAIERAHEELQTNAYLHWDGERLLVLSSTSQNIYASNGVCQCRAFEFGHRPCWHRAAARLAARYAEAEQAQGQAVKVAAKATAKAQHRYDRTFGHLVWNEATQSYWQV